jgi:hypothetical protein
MNSHRRGRSVFWRQNDSLCGPAPTELALMLEPDCALAWADLGLKFPCSADEPQAARDHRAAPGPDSLAGATAANRADAWGARHDAPRLPSPALIHRGGVSTDSASDRTSALIPAGLDPSEGSPSRQLNRDRQWASMGRLSSASRSTMGRPGNSAQQSGSGRPPRSAEVGWEGAAGAGPTGPTRFRLGHRALATKQSASRIRVSVTDLHGHVQSPRLVRGSG